MPNKIKVLFIVTDFYQAGTERFTYEVDTALDKALFEVSILCYISLSQSDRWADYYYEKHQALGTKIYFKQDIDKPYPYTYKQRLERIVFKKPLPPENKSLSDFLDGFDIISFMGEYNYPLLQGKMTAAQKNKSLLHIMNTKHQKPDLYAKFDKTKNHHFVSTFEGSILESELSDFPSYRHTFMPLAFAIDQANFQWKFSASPQKKIGIFTRLTTHKPIDIFLFAFHLLLGTYASAEFHVFGSGDPESEGLMRIVRALGIQDKVFFRGHQENLVETANTERLDLVWFHGYHGFPGGFAGYDICTTGIPQVFWEFSQEINRETADVFPMHIRLEEFVKESICLLTQKDEAEKTSQAQFNFVLDKKDLSKYIKNLESLYQSKINELNN